MRSIIRRLCSLHTRSRIRGGTQASYAKQGEAGNLRVSDAERGPPAFRITEHKIQQQHQPAVLLSPSVLLCSVLFLLNGDRLLAPSRTDR